MALPAAVLAAALAGLLTLGDLARHLPAALALLALGFGALLVAARRLERERRPLAATIVLVAAVLRVLLLPLPATLSDDVLRYVWDGRVVLSGANPYALTPDAPELADLRDERWRRMPHRDVATVYPPLALATFAVAAATPWPVAVLKILLAAADLAGCWLLVGVARRLGVPEGRAVWYAWNPLVVLEVAGMGHVDALAVALTIAAVAALYRGRAALSGLAAGAGVLAKLGPLAALPLWWRGHRHRTVFLAAALALVVAGVVPVLVAAHGVPSGLVRYGVSWEFNGPLYEPLWRVIDGAGVADAIKGGLDDLKARHGNHELWNRFYPWVYPQLLAKLLLGGGMLAALFLAWRERRPAVATGKLFAGLLLCSATVYPWYLLWILPWAALVRHRAWLALSVTVLACYVPQHRESELFPWIFAAVWLPFAVLSFERRPWSTA